MIDVTKTVVNHSLITCAENSQAQIYIQQLITKQQMVVIRLVSKVKLIGIIENVDSESLLLSTTFSYPGDKVLQLVYLRAIETIQPL